MLLHVSSIAKTPARRFGPHQNCLTPATDFPLGAPLPIGSKKWQQSVVRIVSKMGKVTKVRSPLKSVALSPEVRLRWRATPP